MYYYPHSSLVGMPLRFMFSFYCRAWLFDDRVRDGCRLGSPLEIKTNKHTEVADIYYFDLLLIMKWSWVLPNEPLPWDALAASVMFKSMFLFICLFIYLAI